MFNTKKNHDESELAYIWRVGSAKSSGLINSTWQELAEIFNAELGEELTESAYRKKFSIMNRAKAEIFDKQNPSEEEQRLVSLRHDLEKERVKVRDERNELRRVLREQARNESFVEQIQRIITESGGLSAVYPEEPEDRIPTFSSSDMLIPLMDLHYGADIDNWFNQYNDNIFVERMQDYLSAIERIKNLHNCQNAYVVLSELVSGVIHNTLRIESNKNVIEQFIGVCDHIAGFLIRLSLMFNEVDVYITPGNHSRIFPNKDDNRKGENIDNLAIPYLSAKLQNFDNVKFFNNNVVDESMAFFAIRSCNVVAVHGDKDNVDSVVSSISQFSGIVPDIILMGHRHLNKFEDKNGKSAVIQTGCFSGMDNYCLDKRLKGRPSQMISVIDDSGIRCLYPVMLDK